MPRRIVPMSAVEDSLEAHLSCLSRRGGAMYLALLGMVALAAALLPVLQVDVSVRSPGLLRPAVEKHRVAARASGVVEAVGVAAGERVGAGRLLLSLRAAPVEERGRALAEQLAEARAAASDLALLTASGAAPPDPARLHTARFRQEAVRTRGELAELSLRESRAERDLERVRALAQRGLAPARDAEEMEFQLARLRAERTVLLERARGGWQSAMDAARAEARALGTQRRQTSAERALYRVEAPVAGTLEELAALSPGSFVQAGQEIAVLSPDAGLVAEVYVPPRDIGLVRAGQQVRMRIDAFHPSDWGFVTGTVAAVADDFVLLDGAPVFRVRVRLHRTRLALPGGALGELKKGMTLRARFVVARRSLWQLLRDRVSDWLNPSAG